MSIILSVSAIILNLAGVAFAATYIWLNAFSAITDLTARNAGILKITRTSMMSSLVFVLLSCLLTSVEDIENAINRATKLYSAIAISWLIVLLGCGAAMFVAFISKEKFKDDHLKSIKQIFVISLTGALLGMLLAWLLG